MITPWILVAAETLAIAVQRVSQLMGQAHDRVVADWKAFAPQLPSQAASSLARPLHARDGIPGRRIFQQLFQSLRYFGPFFSIGQRPPPRCRIPIA